MITVKFNNALSAVLTLARQASVSTLIATMLLPMFAPVVSRGSTSDLSVLAAIEATVAEVTHDLPSSAARDDNDAKSTSKKTDADVKSSKIDANDVPTAASTEKNTVTRSESSSEHQAPAKALNSSAKNVAAPPALMNQLPDGEHDQLYGYENNLGSPRGKVEADSANRAAATSVRHRAGIANFSFDVPLASLSGRGLDAGIGMTYNSRAWSKTFDGTSDHYTYDVEESLIAPGFSAGLGYVETLGTSNGLVDNDGTRHEFACSAYSGSTCIEYSTNDGTLIKQSAYVTTGGNTTEVVLKFPNGSKTFYKLLKAWTPDRKYFPYRIQDRNGNIVRVDYKDDKGRIDHITDTINRQIKFYYENDASLNPDKLIAVTVPDMSTGEIQTVRLYYDTLTLNSAGKFTGTITAPATIRVLKYVYMPATHAGFKYDYDTNYGMIRKIDRFVGMAASSTGLTATGSISSDGTWAASTTYDYPNGSTALTDVPKYSKRTDDWQGRTGNAQETLYESFEPSASTNYQYYSNITVKDSGFDVLTQSISDQNGFLKETSIWKVVGATNTLMSKTNYTWNTTTRNLSRIEVTNDAGLIKAWTFEYDGYNNQTKARECGYAATGAACDDSTALRRTETSYTSGTNDPWISHGFLSLPRSVTTITAGTTVSRTDLEYDHNGSDSTLTRRNDIDQNTHDIYYNPDFPEGEDEICPPAPPFGDPPPCTHVHRYGYNVGSAYRGNVTKVTRYSDATLATDPSADVSDFEYDIAGNQVSATLSCCNLKTTDYGLTWGVTGYAYPVSETKGSGTPQLTTSATYNTNTGLVTGTINENGQPTTYDYETDTLRPKKTTYANGGTVETFYSDKEQTGSNLLPGYVRQTTTLDSTHTAQSYNYFDARGLGLRSASETPDGWLISAAEYDNLGRTRKSYNPFYGSTPVATIPTGAKFTEVTAIDALGRATGVTLQDNTTVSTHPDESTVTYTAPNSNSITGVSTRVTDQAGKERRQIVDSLGRIVRVDEPNASGVLGAVATPNQPTYYEYDGNDNLSKVIQSDGTTTQNRRFKYDSLSRLVAEYQVEADGTLSLDGTKGTIDNANKWSKVLKYSTHGLLTDGYDARGVHTAMTYDGLNRVSSVAYTGETGYQTPTVTYTYDQSRSGYFNNGALTSVSTAASGESPSTATEFDYDLMSRVVKHRQWVDTQEYDLEYGYNLAGQLTSEKYPSGRIVTNSYDANGRLASIADASRTYLSSLAYQGNAGSLSSIGYGNGTVQTFGMNDRLQMISQELKRGSETLQKYQYGYGQLDANDLVDTTKNNGQLAQIESWIGSAKQWTQKFNYDSIGRLSQSVEYKGSDTSFTYKQVFDYDRFGNMYRKAANNATTGQSNPLPYTAIEDADISKATNRLSSAATIYDNAGNVTQDSKFRNLRYKYDGNGRMVGNSLAPIGGIGGEEQIILGGDPLSVYDAAGMRVAERDGGGSPWTFHVYDIGGNLVADYGGAQSADSGGVKYVLADWEGSTRATVSNTGYVQARMDYTAYGEDLASGTGMRTGTQGFGLSTNLRQKYGLTERDNSTGLDHTWFRKDENRAGRWTSADPYGGSADVGDPQTFNRYSYVSGQPTSFVDPSGLFKLAEGGGGHIFTEFEMCYYFGLGCGSHDPRDGGGEPGGGGGGTTPVKKKPACSAKPFTADIHPGMGKSPVSAPLNFTSDELNSAALTVFGEISSTFNGDSPAEAHAVASEIFNRSLSVMQGGNFGTGGRWGLGDIVSARNGREFAGYSKGKNDYKNFTKDPKASEFGEGDRNCERLKAAFAAVGSIANDLNSRDSYLYNYSNFAGKRKLRPGEQRINGNDFSTTYMQP